MGETSKKKLIWVINEVREFNKIQYAKSTYNLSKKKEQSSHTVTKNKKKKQSYHSFNLRSVS